MVILAGRRQPADRVTLARVFGIICGGKHHAQRHPRIPFRLHGIQPAVDRGFQQRHQIAFQPQHDRLRFGVTHAAVEFQHLERAASADHQPGIQKSGVGHAVRGHAVQHRLYHFAHHPRMNFRGHHRGRRIGAHAAGVRSAVAVLQPLVVLAAGQRQRMAAVGEHDETGFLALQKFLDDHARAG